MSWIRAAHQKMDELVGLRAGWDGYDARPPCAEAYSRAREALRRFHAAGMPAPAVFPLLSGGVQAVWHAPHHRVELDWNASGDAVWVLARSGSEPASWTAHEGSPAAGEQAVMSFMGTNVGGPDPSRADL